MQRIDLGQLEKILFLGAHCDDIEIGCGGTILRMLEERPDLEITWAVLSGTDQRERETRNAASEFGESVRVEVRTFRDGYFPSQLEEVKNYLETLKELDPDAIFTHHRDDLHQDHRVVNQLTWNTFRDHLVLEYEIVKYDGDLGNPDLFISLEDRHMNRKLEILNRCFPSQAKKSWFDDGVFRGLSRIRGVQCACMSGYAEGFYARKLIC